MDSDCVYAHTCVSVVAPFWKEIRKVTLRTWNNREKALTVEMCAEQLSREGY